MALIRDTFESARVVLFFVQDLNIHVLGARHDLAVDHFLDHGAHALGHHGLGCTDTQTVLEELISSLQTHSGCQMKPH